LLGDRRERWLKIAFRAGVDNRYLLPTTRALASTSFMSLLESGSELFGLSSSIAMTFASGMSSRINSSRFVTSAFRITGSF
jgi:hypothetical protein